MRVCFEYYFNVTVLIKLVSFSIMTAETDRVWANDLVASMLEGKTCERAQQLNTERIAVFWSIVCRNHACTKTKSIEYLFKADLQSHPGDLNSGAAIKNADILLSKHRLFKRRASRSTTEQPFHEQHKWTWPCAAVPTIPMCGCVPLTALATLANDRGLDSTLYTEPAGNLICVIDKGTLIIRRYEGRVLLLQLQCASGGYDLYARNDVEDTIANGPPFRSQQEASQVLDQMVAQVLCQGVDPAEAGVYGLERHFIEQLGIDAAKDHPRLHSSSCDVMLPPPPPSRSFRKRVRSEACTKLEKNVKARKKTDEQKTTSDPIATTRNLKTASTQQLREEVVKLREANKNLQLDVKRLERLLERSEVNLSKSSLLELSTATAFVTKDADCHIALDKLLQKDKTGMLTALCQNNCELLLNSIEGKSKQNRFSQHFLRIVFSVYLRSPAAANALRKSGLLAMPSTRTFQRHLKPYKPDFGFTDQTVDLIFHQADRYKACNKALGEGKRQPTGDGILAFDELKIRGKIVLNAANEMSEGFVIGADALSNLEDIYEDIAEDRELMCEYIMVCQWRCLDSGFEFIGPLLQSGKGLNAREIYAYFWTSVEVLGHVIARALVCVYV